MTSSIPESRSTVRVSILSPNRVLGVPASAFLTPDIEGTTYSDTPCLCFLIERENGGCGGVERVLFDLGVRGDWEGSAPKVVDAVKAMDIRIDTPNDVLDLLLENGLELDTINAIVLSHWHFDHIGDPTRFPNTTALVVGPGFQEHCLPGYPTNPDSMVPDGAFRGREVKEVNFEDSELRIAGLQALDWFGDGSFFLLNTPGHAVGHLSALARTTAADDGAGTPASFMLLAGDVCHHAGELRPTELQPLPEPSEFSSHACGEGDEYLTHSTYRHIHPHNCLSRPFYCPSAGGFNMDAELMKKTVERVAVLDADPNVFVVLAHDHWLLDVVELFPRTANAWKEKGWADKAMWRFLMDFRGQEGRERK